MKINGTTRTRSEFSRRPLLVIGLLMLAFVLQARAETVGTQFSIRMTPRAAALIAALRQGEPPAIALAGLPPQGSSVAFSQSCGAEGGSARINNEEAVQQRVCL